MIPENGQISLLETEAYISAKLHEESRFIEQMSSKAMKALSNNLIVTKDKLETDIRNLEKSSSETISTLEDKLECSIEQIRIKDEAIMNMSKEIQSLKSVLEKERLSHEHTKEALSTCQKELQSTGADLERYFQVSENDRKKIHSAYLDMREKAVQESLKCNKYETEFCLLRNDKENCEMKLQKNQREVLRLNKQLKSSKSSFEKNIVNKEAQRQQLQYMTFLKGTGQNS